MISTVLKMIKRVGPGRRTQLNIDKPLAVKYPFPRASEDTGGDETTRIFLQQSNPRLIELKTRYRELNIVQHSMWESWPSKIRIDQFRGEGHYLSQLEWGQNKLKYLSTSVYIDAIDDLRLLYKLPEDARFGVLTFQVFDGLEVTRDLLDSILEITFLREQLKVDTSAKIKVLDIGAGYGRFAHRFTDVFKDSTISCIDAVAESTFLCEFYSKYRKFEDRATIIPLFEFERLQKSRFDLAINIHSWSECTLLGIRFWLGMLADMQVGLLFVVPHDARFLTKERDGSQVSFLPEIKRHGYREILITNKYGESKLMKEHGIFSEAQYALFELQKK